MNTLNKIIHNQLSESIEINSVRILKINNVTRKFLHFQAFPKQALTLAKSTIRKISKKVHTKSHISKLQFSINGDLLFEHHAHL